MQVEHEKCMEIMFHLNAQIEPILIIMPICVPVNCVRGASIFINGFIDITLLSKSLLITFSTFDIEPSLFK